MGESALCLGEDGAGVADGDGHEFHLSPLRFDDWDVFGGLLLNLLMAAEDPAVSDLDDDKVELLVVGSCDPARRCPGVLERR